MIADKGLRWLWDNRLFFDPPSASGVPEFGMHAKPLLELQFLLGVLRKHEIDSLLITRLSTFAVSLSDRIEWHQPITFDPSNAAIPSLLQQFYAVLQLPPPFESAYMSRLRDLRFFDGTDRLPYRQMDLSYGLSSFGWGDTADLALWFSYTAFGNGQTALRYGIQDLYSLTHAVFYLSDVGLYPNIPGLDVPTTNRLHRELVKMAAIMVRGDHLDVLAELLLCVAMCKVQPINNERRLLECCLSYVEASLHKDGTLPPTLIHSPPPGANARQNFDYLYHTTLVSVFLFSFLAMGDRWPMV